MTTAVIEWSGGVGAVVVPVLAPLGRDGLALTRPFGSDPRGAGSAGVAYIPRPLLVRWALEIVATCPEVGPVAVWPHGVAVEQTALALAVGGLLAAARPVGSVAPVVCAARPPIRRSRPTASYEVRAEVEGRRVDLAVWEVFPFARPTAVTGLPVGRAA
ncbi:hypothetical protein I6A60_38215 [Frankia sp. AgB1.9]|uniref:hypothetical protein n=1 Tax=unclassified Frankia TaxID=2632575 RepID=UPI001933A1DC|nr:MULTISPECIES: hypothetical protein [unclassified Frankia]MBL7486761.1 hypothetical protein [Frankia sp. AgW1.1]MBL7553626.1 hypothetical protein [Frankia sp. AgB1.9]MBL7618399.1 hypothetical protein [Frankia sp. AgB1.8]